MWDVTELRPESCWKWTQARERVDCASMKRQKIRHTSHTCSEGAADHEQLVRIGRAPRLAAKTMPEAVLTKEGRCSSDAPLVYVRANMQDPLWESELWGNGAVEDRGNRDKGLDETEKTGTTLPDDISTVLGPL